MDNENITQKALEKSMIYIDNVARGNAKGASRLQAGYSGRSTTMPEKTKAYAFAIEKLLTTNKNSMSMLSDAIEAKLSDTDVLTKLSIQEVAHLHKILADIHKILTPQVTIKEEQLKDGSMKRTTWGQGSLQGNVKED